MDITKYNFEEEFDNIKEAIEESTFLAIDGEFTGLTSGSEHKQCYFDTPADRYRKIVNGSSDFLLVQFGLVAFKANESEKRYEARPFNFYIFPRPMNHQSPDRRFLCQSSSIDFLISHDFDFNKLFKEGIPYLNYDQEVALKEKKQADRANSSFSSAFRSPGFSGDKKNFVVPPEHKEFIKNIRAKVDAYIKSEETESMALSPCDAFQRKMIYRSLEQDYPLLTLETKTTEKKERFIQVSKCSSAEEKEKKREDKERMELDIQVGFTKVMKLITESGKLVVGHNMYLDVLHSFNHFYGPAPKELGEFKEVISSIFPKLLDTKLVANTAPFKEYFLGTSLDELKVTMKQPPFKEAQVDLPESFSRYGNDGGAYHEAGYDAFVTGSCFASLINFLGRYQNPASNFLLPTHHSVQPFVNKLYMMRVLDIPYVDLAGPDVEPARDNVFHVTFPEEWRSTDLYQLFEPYGNIQISWLTSTTAYVGIMKKENAKKIMQGLCQSAVSYQIISYAAHRLKMQLKSQSTPNPADKAVVASTPKSAAPKPSGGPIAAGVKRRSPSPTDIIYPPTKLPRKSLTKENVTYPSIPEEDEKGEEVKKMKKSKQEEVDEEEEDIGVPADRGDIKRIKKSKVDEEEEDIGVPAEKEEIEKIKNGKGKSKTKAAVSAEGDASKKASNQKKDSSGSFQLFEEPDTW